MAGLMGVPRVRQALIALKPVDRERFGGYARYCLKFQREDLTAEVCMFVHPLVPEKRLQARRLRVHVCDDMMCSDT